jgi:hypothetical protein
MPWGSSGDDFEVCCPGCGEEVGLDAGQGFLPHFEVNWFLGGGLEVLLDEVF